MTWIKTVHDCMVILWPELFATRPGLGSAWICPECSAVFTVTAIDLQPGRTEPNYTVRQMVGAAAA